MRSHGENSEGGEPGQFLKSNGTAEVSGMLKENLMRAFYGNSNIIRLYALCFQTKNLSHFLGSTLQGKLDFTPQMF